MAEAMIGGLLADHLVEPSAIVASHHREARTADLKARLGIDATTDNRAAAHDAQVVVLSVKPQVLRTVFKELGGAIQPVGAGALDCGRRAHRVNRPRSRPPRHRSIHAEYASAGRRRYDRLDRDL